ncbi:amino acid permease [Haliangium ochraceum]|uniref:Amino acid permease-associated region n=1 Tax=Haliangium ochraceum (strain DSM 14365 / JCM 11303 / SMP-2) TaxID=502025 RepID=D0LSU2_HALO1|nr:amino acid permease [Haliangium ochraceum]ACY17314.1 amino acid permease-associated region [Haliangium ochraceum DSM 14365]
MPTTRLKKQLGLFDVYSVSTGAMFSSGFFLLPGLAFAEVGPGVVLAYLLAGFLIIPAMLSSAELATAMPRAGGAYFFLDRALGPMAGTLGGWGTWLALVLKTSFALVGVGAYLALFWDLPMKTVALVLTALFFVVNLVGAKETTGLQRILVSALVGILTLFTLAGLLHIAGHWNQGDGAATKEAMRQLSSVSVEGLLGAIGLVFVSYAGLTKVASVAEEVQDPDRAIPRGMLLSLLTATAFYVVGVAIMVIVLDPVELSGDLTPVASAGAEVMSWLPGSSTAVLLIVVAAVAAFASTANAGIMSASRYLFAMGRDELLSRRMAKIGRFGTPTLAIVSTSAVVALSVLTLDVASLAKLASAFQLLMFSLLNLAVIVMRESRIESYDPGYRSPLYPWMQILGFVVPLVLIGELGHVAIVFTAGVAAASLGWYFAYARHRVMRSGAVLHWFARMGLDKDRGLDAELREILKERGLRERDPLAETIAGAPLVHFAESASFEQAARQAAEALADITELPTAELCEGFCTGSRTGATPVAHGVALPHLRIPDLVRPVMVVVRAPEGVRIDIEDITGVRQETAHALFFLVSPTSDPAQHLRLLAAIASVADDDDFKAGFLAAKDGHGIRALLGSRLPSFTDGSGGGGN